MFAHFSYDKPENSGNGLSLASGPLFTKDKSESWLHIMLPNLVHLRFTSWHNIADSLL
jgi:hypothetical protein